MLMKQMLPSEPLEFQLYSSRTHSFMQRPKACEENSHESHGDLFKIVLEVLHVRQRLRAEDDRDP
jgi:hypothetical protein